MQPRLMDYPGKTIFANGGYTNTLNASSGHCSGVAEGSSQGANTLHLLLFDPIPKPSVQKACRNFVNRAIFGAITSKLEMGLCIHQEVERTVLP